MINLLVSADFTGRLKYLSFVCVCMIPGGKFIFGAATIDSLPVESVPEVAIAGRSNCGKSTMINVIFNKKKLARVSSNPGCTRQINFYSAQNDAFLLADLPGYGYAKVSHKQIRAYSDLINHYLLNRKVMKGVLILMDSKVGMKESDFQFSRWLTHYSIPFAIVLTKVDKVTTSYVSEICQSVKQKLITIANADVESIPFHVVSAKSGFGINGLIRSIVDLSGI